MSSSWSAGARRVLHGQRVWDAAQQVLARQEGFVRTKALLAVAGFSPLFHRYSVRPLLRMAIIVAVLFQPGVIRGFHLFDGGAMLRASWAASSKRAKYCSLF